MFLCCNVGKPQDRKHSQDGGTQLFAANIMFKLFSVIQIKNNHLFLNQCNKICYYFNLFSFPKTIIEPLNSLSITGVYKLQFELACCMMGVRCDIFLILFGCYASFLLSPIDLSYFDVLFWFTIIILFFVLCVFLKDIFTMN